jgi:excisionase family DNA binding protein
VSTPDRRTVGELLADSEALARETLLDATLEQAPAMVRSWNQLVGSAADLWAALPSTADNPSGPDLMERLRVIGEAIGRSVTAGHWSGKGPAEEHLMEIAENLSRARHLVERPARNSQPTTPKKQPDNQDPSAQVMHTLYVAAHGTAVALNAYVTDLKHRSDMGRRRRQPMAERPTALEITEAQGMIARFGGFEQLAAAYLFGQPPISANPGLVRSAARATRLGSALAAREMQAHRTLAAGPDPADLVRVARVQVLITTAAGILTEATARYGHIDRDMIQQLGPALEANQVAWSRAAKRWGELTSPASRTDPALVAAASEVRAAIAATATNQAGWATPDQLASRVDLPAAVKTLHLSMVASVDIAHVVRDTAAHHPGLTAPARIIGMRAQGEAEIAIEQGETRYEGVTWTTRRQIATNQLIPLPEPARRGLINLADDVIATAWPGPTARDSRTWARGCYAREAAMELLIRACGRNPTGQERNTIMELLMATAAEAADMLGVSCSSLYRLIAAKPLESIKIGRSRRVSVLSIRHVAAASAGVELVEPRTARSGELATPEESEEVGDVFSA